jgi:hypothetical protein
MSSLRTGRGLRLSSPILSGLPPRGKRFRGVIHVSSTGEGCDLPQCLPTLAGFGRHPNSRKRALKEVRVHPGPPFTTYLRHG